MKKPNKFIVILFDISIIITGKRFKSERLIELEVLFIDISFINRISYIFL